MACVLLVDDDAGVRETCGVILRQAGWKVDAVGTGRRALASLKRRPCDLLLLDLKLPDMTGLDMLDQARQQGWTGPAILVTGYPSLDSSVQALRLGAADYLAKPVFGDALLAAVRRGLGETRSVGLTTATGASPAAEPAVVEEPGPGLRLREELLTVADGLALWLDSMQRVVSAPRDVPTVGRWAALLKCSDATVYAWCRTVELEAKASLNLARVLRAVRCARQRRGEPARYLAVSNRNTAARLLARAGLEPGRVPTMDEVLTRQTFVRDPQAVVALRVRLREGDRITEDLDAPGGTPSVTG